MQVISIMHIGSNIIRDYRIFPRDYGSYIHVVAELLVREGCRENV